MLAAATTASLSTQWLLNTNKWKMIQIGIAAVDEFLCRGSFIRLHFWLIVMLDTASITLHLGEILHVTMTRNHVSQLQQLLLDNYP